MSQHIKEQWKKKSAENQKAYRHILQKKSKNEILKLLPDLHEVASSKVNCLECAACCKGYSPRFKTPDIKRIARTLSMKEGAFIDTYLRIDEDGDYVLQSSPCAFLGPDNKCSIYNDRPSDCARFPYTDEDVIVKRVDLTLKNASFCPIVFEVLEGIKEKLG